MKAISAEELDKKFDDGEDISEYLDWSKARGPGQELTPVAFDLTVDELRALDTEAKRLGVSRQDLLQLWIAERLSSVGQR
ncbi:MULTISPECIES: type II toxin-antitoxin system BrnA family antitoxin [unclassified Rhizobium]|uniref:type II toxin-antitoxin system BrnA family antitoxin n=1 Tax=unclassified Rhizobium TaxID=2613769 RepID=UPI001ADC7963|nr:MULTISPECIES: CopG family transcriptional regulator [unclassified Rhizobium]MBO9125070.1 CopG family transcriptional regulator [Rhizobium sp. 16-488-2b]MBO9175655.1 CopG family transcriptional regulator [Rhizobium sp. 16-488-2a]